MKPHTFTQMHLMTAAAQKKGAFFHQMGRTVVVSNGIREECCSCLSLSTRSALEEGPCLSGRGAVVLIRKCLHLGGIQLEGVDVSHLVDGGSALGPDRRWTGGAQWVNFCTFGPVG